MSGTSSVLSEYLLNESVCFISTNIEVVFFFSHFVEDQLPVSFMLHSIILVDVDFQLRAKT